MEAEQSEVSQCKLLASSDNIDKLVTALVAAQLKMPTVAKTKLNPFFKSKYADLSSVVEAAEPIIGAEGLAVSQFISNQGGATTLKTFVMHTSGQWMGDEMILHMKNSTAQDQGSATTYARRYAYCAALGIVSDEDDDGNGSTQRAQSAAAESKQPEKAQDAAKTTRVKAPKAASEGAVNLAGLFTIKGRSGEAIVPADDDERRTWAGKILAREVVSFKDLTQADVDVLKKEAKKQALETPRQAGYSDEDDGERPF